ncbi:uncharacterized protein SCHCODRAFT_02507343 [Schizophyllum commune H4-8]|nr:uncharacterized protein SCHCODRAFT_02507343 [Schizophyllum commune H4-8]KAI5890542.1 hypothetical protein SCHCODRAFT_02507343 [Schizophyllum commune H4-8]
MLVRPSPPVRPRPSVCPYSREPYYPSIALVLAQNGSERPEDKYRPRRAARRHRCVRKPPPEDEGRGRQPLSFARSEDVKPGTTKSSNGEDDFLMRTMVFLDEDPWAPQANELQEALGQGRNASGRLQKIKRFSTLVIDLALRKARAYSQKLRKAPPS